MSVNLTRQILEEMIQKEMDSLLQEQEQKTFDPTNSVRKLYNIQKQLETKNVPSFQNLIEEVRVLSYRLLEFSTSKHKTFRKPQYWEKRQGEYESLYGKILNYLEDTHQDFDKNKKAAIAALKEISTILTYTFDRMKVYDAPTKAMIKKAQTSEDVGDKLLLPFKKDIQQRVLSFKKLTDTYRNIIGRAKKAQLSQGQQLNVQRKSEEDLEKRKQEDKNRVDVYNVILTLDILIANAANAGSAVDPSLFKFIYTFEEDATGKQVGNQRRFKQQEARFTNVKNAIEGKRIRTIPGVKDLINTAAGEDLDGGVYSRIRKYGIDFGTLREQKKTIKKNLFEQLNGAKLDTGGPGGGGDGGGKRTRGGGKGRSSRKGRFMRGQESFRAEFEARFGAGREGFEEFYDNLALHGIKIKQDRIFGKDHAKAFQKYLRKQKENPKFATKFKPEVEKDIRAERPDFYKEKDELEKKEKAKEKEAEEKAKKVIPPEAALRRLRNAYTQKLQDIFQKASNPREWQNMYENLKSRMTMAYVKMTGEEFDRIDERDRDAMMMNVLPSLSTELDLNRMAIGREPVITQQAGTFKRGFFIPFDEETKRKVEQWKASFKA